MTDRSLRIILYQQYSVHVEQYISVRYTQDLVLSFFWFALFCCLFYLQCSSFDSIIYPSDIFVTQRILRVQYILLWVSLGPDR